MKSYIMVAKKPQGHKDVFDPEAPKDSVEEIPGKPGLKSDTKKSNTSGG